MSGSEDREIQDYFIETAFPSEALTDVVLGSLVESGKKLTDLEREVNLSRGRLSGLLKILEVEGAVERDGSVWRRSDRPWSYPRERVEAVTADRRREQVAMVEYTRTDRCLMEFLRSQLDDEAAEPCGKCANCLGHPVVDPGIDVEIRARALAFLNRTEIPIAPRKRWPVGVRWGSLSALGNHEGRALGYRGDPGRAELAWRAIRKRIGFPAELVEAMAQMIEQWEPEPAPSWITAVPNAAETDRVSNFAERLASRLGLPFVPAVERVRDRPPQAEMFNSARRLENVRGAFEVSDAFPGPALLVDDMVDSRWTLTAVGHQLRAAGVDAVHPVVLIDASRGGA